MWPGGTPPIYKGIVLHVLGDSALQEYKLNPLSRGNFIKSVERCGGIGLVALKDYDPKESPKLTVPEEVELDNGAEFVVIIPSTSSNLEQRITSLEGWKKNRTEGRERQLGEALRKYAKLNHPKVKVVCNMKFRNLEGNDRELDAVAFAGGCVFVGEYKNKMDTAAAAQLASAINDIKLLNALGPQKGNPFYGKEIFGVLAGAMETKDTKDLKNMDKLVKNGGFLKWVEGVDFYPDPNSASPAFSCVPAAIPDGQDASPGNGTAATASSALPRRVRHVTTPKLRAQLQVRPRLVPKFAGFKSCSLIYKS